MDVQAKLAETKQKFEETQTQRNNFIEQANACMTEMNKLEGEWRLLQEMQPSEPATTLVATPEPEVKPKKKG